MTLIEETVIILKNTLIDDISLLNLVYSSYDPNYDTWSGESCNIIEVALNKAAKSIPKRQLIEEYNELADQYDCGHIEDWDYKTHQLELEMFIDEIYDMIKDLKET